MAFGGNLSWLSRLMTALGLVWLFLTGQSLAIAIPSIKSYETADGTIGRAGIHKVAYKTEPDFMHQNLEYRYADGLNKSSLSPGYIFVATMRRQDDTFPGPQIYDMDGHLVWFGNPFVEHRGQDFKVCDYLGSKGTHLCWSERELNPAARKPIVHKVFADNTYSFVRNYSTRSDGHEFRVVDHGSTFLSMDYKKAIYDLRPFHGEEDGWIKDACIVEFDTKTGNETFEWCYAEAGLDLGESTIFFPAQGQQEKTSLKAGKGLDINPWDFAHMNAIDKNTEGDFLASLRHLDSIYKIAGPSSSSGEKPGTILWRLGGKSNDFEMDFNFSKQHDVRFVSVSENETIISLFDNAWEGANEPTADFSSGKIIRINNATKTASLIHDYPHPEGSLSGSRGSIQITDNGNAFIGWGALPEMSEFSEEGKLLYHAKFAAPDSHQYSYRAYKFPWVAKPYWGPKLVPYSHGCVNENMPLYAYVSWNGATEVKQWHFLVAYQPEGPWEDAGVFEKHGFETRVELDETAPYVAAEALDASGKILGRVEREIFVPRIKSECDEFSCPNHFVYDDSASRGATCKLPDTPSIFPFALFLIFLELASYWWQHMSSRSIDEKVNQESLNDCVDLALSEKAAFLATMDGDIQEKFKTPNEMSPLSKDEKV